MRSRKKEPDRSHGRKGAVITTASGTKCPAVCQSSIVNRQSSIGWVLPRSAFVLILILAPGSWLRAPSDAYAQERPVLLRDVGIDQRLDTPVPLDLRFRDEAGRSVQLAEYFGSKPVLLALVYYDCPMLCTQVLNGLVSSLKVLTFEVGKEFEVVTVSFDSRETPELAASKKTAYVERYGRSGAATGWHFLTGDASEIGALTRAVGFRYAYDPRTAQFAHASGVILVTPKGRISRYFYGIEYAPRDLRLGLVEASENRIGSSVDQLLLFCYHYDPKTGKYGPVIMGFVQLGGGATLLGLGILIWTLQRKVRGRRRRDEEGAG